MNHIRLCAGDRGRNAGRSAASSAGRARSPSARSASSASPATVGSVNRSRTARFEPTAALICATTRVADSELPPSEKKLSPAPTIVAPTTSAKMPATISSTGLLGG